MRGRRGYQRTCGLGLLLAVATVAPACGRAPDAPTAVPRAWTGGALVATAQARRVCGADAPLPCPLTETVVAAGDISCAASDPSFKGTATKCRMLATANLASTFIPQDVLLLGDLQYGTPNLAGFQSGFDTNWGRFKAIAHPVPGNHEYELAGAPGYFSYFGAQAGPVGQGWYSYDEAGWHIVALNANCTDAGGCAAGSTQAQWLQADLAASNAACTLAFWHQPRFSSHAEGDIADTSYLWALLYQHGAELVISGHHHHYERFTRMDASGNADPATGVREIIAGTGGRSLDPFVMPKATSQVRVTAFGVLVLDLSPNSYSWRFVDEQGVTRDSDSDACHAPPS